jgi:plasmid replication initiation protein
MNELVGDLEIWQSNALVEASHSMTLNEKRLIYAAAAVHNPRLPMPSKNRVRLHVDDFADVFGLSNSNQVYEALSDAAERLFNRRIRKISDSPRGRGRKIIENMRWVSYAKYDEGEGTVTLGFCPEVAPYLTLIHNEFTRFKLKNIGNIGSYYGLRIYELCCQYRTTGQRTIPLAKLREMLDLGDKYPRVDSLRQRVLDPAIAEVNKHTDLTVVMKTERKGRKVVGFHFDITQDDQIPLDLPEAKEAAA